MSQEQDQHHEQTFLDYQDLDLSTIITAPSGLDTLVEDEPANPAMLFKGFDSLDSPDGLVEGQRMIISQPEPIEPMNISCAPLTGVYSSSGFDMIGILSRVINRPNPLINLGPIDMSCSFLVTDARQLDCPIVYCSPNFETLTGYKSEEILGRNCRFLQAPDGQVTEGSRRQHTDNLAVYHLKSYLLQSKEHQASIINYKKGGQKSQIFENPSPMLLIG
ncbi:hypothetical protein BX666DRAFT_2023773 [Dichotomocladium elegans]|nr:hypothetical protein BX666DRAFT_2023773 [Dichotomocladium elegans]